MIFTDEQRLAMQHVQGPALTLAIPGSGKTTLLIGRIHHLNKEHGIPPSHILTLTFSKASAIDMQRRFIKQYPDENLQQGAFMTIHKFAYQLYRHYLAQTQTQKRLLEDGTEKYHLLNHIFKKRHHASLTEDQFESLSNHIGFIYNMQINDRNVHEHPFTWNDTLDMAREFHLHKKKHGLFDFDDMLIEAIRILEKHPTVLAKLKQNYPMIQVDEAQDTSKLQFQLIEMLMGDSKNLFLVADDDQSIYGFRGAYPNYLLTFQKRHPEATLYYLSENFRSDAHIVHASEALIARNDSRYPKAMKPTKDAKLPVRILEFSDLADRNTYLMNQVKHSKGSNAILYRNKISALCLSDALEREGIPFKVKDFPSNEWNHPLLNDILSFFQLAMIPQDLSCFDKMAYKLNAYISRDMKEYVLANYRGRNVFDILIEIPFLQDYQTRTQEQLKEKFEHLQYLRPYDAIHFIEVDLGYLSYLKDQAQALGISISHARARLDAYKAIAAHYKTLFDFIQRIDYLKEHLIHRLDTSDDALTLSTIHGAKGLEFDYTAIVDINPDIFPSLEATKKNALLEEERRLFYVALTRAKSRLELLHVSFINGSNNKHSQFLNEVLSQNTAHHTVNNRT